MVLRGRFASGAIEIAELGFGQAGGRIQMLAALRAVDDVVGRLTLRLDATGLDAAQLARSAALQSARLSGQATAGITLDIAGETLGAALRNGRGQAVVTMIEGRIARSALEAASTNILALFRDQDGTARIRCLVAAADLRDGRTTIAPLRLRTTEATISGGGSIDLGRARMDLLIGSESASTGFFALDIPVRISGPFRNLDIGPSRSTPPRRFSLSEGFPAEQRALAERSGCLR
nr:AsmA-like C-terminal region-containing protein [Plastoroseomonas hellenica]